MTDKLELKSCHEVIDTVDVANIESIFHGKPIDPDILTVVMKDGKRLYCDEVCPIDEPVSEELFEASAEYAATGEILANGKEMIDFQKQKSFIAGAKWQKNHLWKPADGDDLPEYEREVVVFTQNYPDDAGMMMVAIGHRPNPEGFDGKSFTTGEVEHYIPKTYGKGGWNIPDVKWWLDCLMPNMEEE